MVGTILRLSLPQNQAVTLALVRGTGRTTCVELSVQDDDAQQASARLTATDLHLLWGDLSLAVQLLPSHHESRAARLQRIELVDGQSVVTIERGTGQVALALDGVRVVLGEEQIAQLLAACRQGYELLAGD